MHCVIYHVLIEEPVPCKHCPLASRPSGTATREPVQLFAVTAATSAAAQVQGVGYHVCVETCGRCHVLPRNDIVTALELCEALQEHAACLWAR